MSTLFRSMFLRNSVRLLLSPVVIFLLIYHLCFSVYLQLVKRLRKTKIFPGC